MVSWRTRILFALRSLCLSVWLALPSLRRAAPTADDVARESWRTDTTDMGLRSDDAVRDRFRRSWLRLLPREPRER